MAFRSTVACAACAAPTSSEDGALAWYAISTLLAASQEAEPEQKLKLHHMLMSTISVLPLGGLLERVLDEISRVLKSQGEHSRKELVQTLYPDIVERVGNAERETVLKWWFSQVGLVGGSLPASDSASEASTAQESRL